MTWVLWLAAPVLTTSAAAVCSWLRTRPPREPSAQDAVREHNDYLAALELAARVTGRAGGHSGGR